MTDFCINQTMKRLGYLYPVMANTPEGLELSELVYGMLVEGGKELDIFILANYAYTLGMARGKQIDRERRKIGKKTQRDKRHRERELLERYLSASPEVQKAVKQMLKSKDTSPEAIKQILIDCGVSEDDISRWENAQATA